MIDVTVIATAAISGGVGLAAAGLQARTSRRQMQLDDSREERSTTEQRRRERRESYETVMDLLSALGWDLDDSAAGADVVERFSKPFTQAVNRIRLYGSPESIAALDAIQAGFASLNAASDERRRHDAWRAIDDGIDSFYDAARLDVGPRSTDGLTVVAFQRGAGPRT